MTDSERERDVALTLMRMALALLDRCGETSGAILFQHAIDKLEGVPVREPTDAEIAAILGSSSDRNDAGV